MENNEPIKEMEEKKDNSPYGILIGLVIIVIAVFCFPLVSDLLNKDKEDDNPITMPEVSEKEEDKPIEINKEEALANIKITEKIRFSNGSLFFILTNDNARDIHVKLNVEFFNQAGESLGVSTKSAFVAQAKSEFIINFSKYDIKDDYATYKTSLEVEAPEREGAPMSINLATINNSGTDITVSTKNTSDKVIERAEACLIYTNLSKPVYYDCSFHNNVKSGEDISIQFSYDYEKKNEGLVFDDFKVYFGDVYYSKN